MNKTIAIFNQAGGVGKSTITMNLGYELYRRGRKTLLIDMDQQGSLTDFLGIESADIELNETIGEAIKKGTTDVESLPIKNTICGLELIPSGWDLGDLELELAGKPGREFLLKEALSGAQEVYDYILLDCPPSRSIIPYISLCASSHLLIPIETQYKALKATIKLFRMVMTIRKYFNRDLDVLGFIPSKFNERYEEDKKAMEIMVSQLPSYSKILEAIPNTTSFAKSSKMHVPIAELKTDSKPTYRAIKAFEKIANFVDGEVEEKKVVGG